MVEQFFKFVDVEIEKKKIHSFKKAIKLVGLDIKNILVSYKFSCLTGSSNSVALTLLLIIVFGFPTLISIIYDSKEITQFKY